MGGDKGAGQELGGQEGEVVIYSEGLGFCVKMIHTGHLHAAYCSTEGSVLEGLEAFDRGGVVGGGGIGGGGDGGIREPDRGAVSKQGSN